MTNRDYLFTLRDEELSHFLICPKGTNSCFYSKMPSYRNCKRCIANWLREERNENDTVSRA